MSQQGLVGTKFDAKKPRLDLVPPVFVVGTACVLGFGANKYGARNWEKGIAFGRIFGAVMRHLWSWWAGERHDPETGLPHLWHAGCNLAFLMHYEAEGRYSQWDDRPSV